MAVLREILARFDIQVDPKGELKKGASNVDSMADKLSKLGNVLAGVAIVQGIRGFVSGLSEAGDQIIDTSAQLGIGTEDFQRWGLAAKLSGADAETFGASIKKMQIKAAEAAASGAETGGIFKELGVQLREGAGGPMRETTEILYDTGIAISKLSDPMARNKAATEAFGKAGAKLGPMFAQGEEGLQGLLAELDKLGGGYSDEALKQMGELGDQTDRYEFALTSLKGAIALQILPTINKLITKGAELVGAFNKTEGAATKLKIGLGILGTMAAAAGARAIVPWLPFMALLAGIYLLVQDVVVGMNGGKSVIGTVLDKLLGKGAGDSIFKQIKEDVKDLAKAIETLKDPGKIIEEIFSRIGATLVKFFKDDIPAAIGVATKEMTGADTTWKHLFETAGDREKREREERRAERQKLAGEATSGNETSKRVLEEKLAEAEKQKGKWDAAVGNMTDEQKRTFESKNVVAGVTDPRELWQENITGLKAALASVAGEGGALADARSQRARLAASLGDMSGYAVTRTNEEYGTRVEATNQVQVMSPINITVADAATAATVASGFTGGAVRRGVDAALRTSGADQ